MKFSTSLVIVASAAFLVAAVVPLSALGASKASHVVGCKAESGKQLASTKSYRFALVIGMEEKMYTPTQIKTMHPKTGEVMLRGTMAAMGQMPMGSSMRHVETQICSRSNGAVSTKVKPTITLTDLASKTPMATMVPIAVMEGIGKGLADLHYGNNVQMTAGHRYTVKIVLNGETTTFQTRLSKP